MKIGILTLFYGSRNYGGVLQAYALCYFLKKCGFDVEQICHKRFAFKPTVFGEFFFRIKKIPWYCMHLRQYLEKFRERFVLRSIIPPVNMRISSFEEFSKKFVSQSKKIYCNDDVIHAFNEYDVVIVGSDQVWTFNSTTEEHLLEHVPNGVRKVAYAASCAKSILSEFDVEKFEKYLPRFDAISVREQDSVALLQPYAGKNKVEWVLDPTMLLTREDWDELCPQKLVDSKYMFCYFLGPDKNMRDVAQKYAKKHGLKLVTLPHLTGKILADVGFGDEQLYDISPADFLSLIKYADCVFTDSFHGSVISLLYHKQFYTFSRLNASYTDNRMTSLLSMFDAEERFLNITERMSVGYVEQLQDLDYSQDFLKFEEMKKSSMEFLGKALR